MNPFLPTVTEFLAGLLWIAALEVCVLVPLIALAARLCGSAWQAARIWKAGLYALLLTPLATALLPHCYVFYAGRREPVPFPSLRLPGTVIWPARLARDVVGVSPEQSYRVLVWLWGIVAAVRVFQLAHGWRTAVQLLRSGRPVRDRRVRELLDELPCGVQLRDVSVLVVPSVPMAACWRLQRPTVLLSPELYRLPWPELRMVLTHEFAHLCQNHSLAMFASSICSILYWFHPLVFWTVRQFHRWAELACDEYVLANVGEPRAYAALLARLSLEGNGNTAVAKQPLGTFLDSSLRPLERVRWVLQHSQPLRASCWPNIGAVIALGLLLLSQCIVALGRLDVAHTSLVHGRMVWTAWPTCTARIADLFGVALRDYPLDAFRYDASATAEPSPASEGR